MANGTHRVVIIGGGFGGLYAAKAIARIPGVEITLIDRRNFHLFQPLLYQVATGSLGAGDIAFPLRTAVRKFKNVDVLYAEATDVLPQQQVVQTTAGQVAYDTLIVAAGVGQSYFGHPEWEAIAPGMKTIEDAIEVRHRIFLAFEAADIVQDEVARAPWMTFVVVGAGPTGVELAGAVAELAHSTLRQEYQSIDTAQTRILLVEGADRVLPPFPPDLSERAAQELTKMGVEVRLKTLVSDIQGEVVTLKSGDNLEQIRARTVLWAAGTQAPALSKQLAERTGATLDRPGRIQVEPDLSIPNHPDIFVIGDLANFAHQPDADGKPLPGVAQVAIQQGHYLGKLLRARVQGKPPIGQFRYTDKGSLAVIGRNSAVADINGMHMGGFLAWLIWIFVHIAFLVGFDRKLMVMTQWAWNYLTSRRGSRLILNTDYLASLPDPRQFTMQDTHPAARQVGAPAISQQGGQA